jgi:hypothetical protein
MGNHEALLERQQPTELNLERQMNIFSAARQPRLKGPKSVLSGIYSKRILDDAICCRHPSRARIGMPESVVLKSG